MAESIQRILVRRALNGHHPALRRSLSGSKPRRRGGIERRPPLPGMGNGKPADGGLAPEGIGSVALVPARIM